MAEELKQKVLSRNHHKAVLSEMFKFVESQCLTDVSFVCQNGTLVYAHRKVLVEISPLLRKIANSRPKEDRLFISTNDIPKEVLVNFLSLTYKGEVKHLSEVEINQVNQVCQLFGVDIPAVQLNKAKPKDSPTRKKNMTLGRILKEPIDIQENVETQKSVIDDTNSIAKKSEKKKRVLHQEGKNHSTSDKKPRSSSSSTNVPVKYCLCREPERPGMIGCDYCEEWYHISCLNLKKEDAKQLTKCKWQCPKCELESKKQAKVDKSSVGQGTEKPRRNARKPSLPTKRPSSTLSSSSSSSSPSSSSSSGSSSDSDSSNSNAPEPTPTLKKPKLVTRNGTNNESFGRKSSTDELHFCYICKSIFISQNAKEAHDKEQHS